MITAGQLNLLIFLKLIVRTPLLRSIRFYIILPKNLFGVDINLATIGIAKARMFLSVVKFFDYTNKDYLIRFSNITCNLKTGNSLIGYIDSSLYSPYVNFKLKPINSQTNHQIY